MATSNQQAKDTTDSLAGSGATEAQNIPDRSQNPAKGDGDNAAAAGEVSKSAAKKAAKKEKLAAGKADKANNKGGGKPDAKASKAPKKKIEGAALVGIDVAKEDDFSEWYNQVLKKGDMMANYEVSGCYILKVISPR
jgi:prolyl-tRNA synthetase